MNKKNFIPNEPIYIGFVGPAGSGKTFTAKSIVPPSTASLYGNPEMFPKVVWDHQWMSLPLYSVYNARTQTLGASREDRILYSIHDIVNSVTMKQLPFDEMIELIYDLYSLPITNQEDEKPRTFLQQAGDLFLKNNENCLAKYTRYKLYSTWLSTSVEYDRHDLEAPTFFGIISDVRQLHEARMIHELKNSLLIRFEADEDTIRERLMARDGFVLSNSESVHRTEKEIDIIPTDWYDLVVDTSSLTPEEQVKTVKEFILSHNFNEESSSNA